MNKRKVREILHWLPRILGILFVIFISLLSVDLLERHADQNLVGTLFINAIPTIIFAGVLFVAWKWEEIGGYLYIVLGFVYVWLSWGEPAHLIIPIVSVVIGFLFWLEHYTD